ncbi:hypothetical protein EDB83DRAFT_2326832 [Lactarius deliciosus]|nr:hypothetical protein EDB83DRAFT_2326832 [Lactarius deliciosus]
MRAVSMEVKDMTFAYPQHESAHMKAQNSKGKGKGKGKGKEKCRREDDIPPALSPDMTWQLDCLVKLQQHIACNLHSVPGKKVYCFVEQSVEDTTGGHEKLTHEDMTLWAKHMSLRKATIHRPPNVIKFDHQPAKRARTGPACYDLQEESRVPTLMELLWLMDEYELADGLSYVNIGEEFTDLGIMDSVDLYSLPLELLALFGGLGHDLAHHLHQFCGKLFIPLGLVETMDDNTPENNSQQEVALQDRAPVSIGDDEVINVVSDEETSVDGAERTESREVMRMVLMPRGQQTGKPPCGQQTGGTKNGWDSPRSQA